MGNSAGVNNVGSRSMQPEELAFVREARVGRLATVDARNRPAIVPFCFAVIGEEHPIVISALDEKPKRVADEQLTRVRNIEANPDVCFVVDRYDEDWSRLAFVQVRGRARLLPAGGGGHLAAVAALREKYPQYATMAIELRPMILIEHLCAVSWRGDGELFA